MKSLLLAVCVLGASAAFGQAATPSVSSQAHSYTFESYPAHASRQSLAMDRGINGNEIMVYAQGERPLWEVATIVPEVPLGDSARALRREHASAKKAEKVYQNQ